MSNARKLQTEIDRTMKKVDEGVELFDEIWDKLYSAEQANQKDKYEGELKKEIKKLQRLRDTIKSWISGNDVKDKEPLLEARKLIETKMEAFKTCEKEMKTKTYSKEGLAKAEQLSPEEEAKQKTSEWISDMVDRLQALVQDKEVEVERLQAGKGKKTNKHLIDDCKHYITMHKFHLQKLEGIMRLVNNDVLEVDIVDPIKDDLDYYLESYEDIDYQQAYDEEFFYESLGLENLDIVNVDRLTTAGADAGKGKKGKGDDDAESRTSKGSSKDTKKSKKTAASSGMIPLTIGRARASKSGATDTTTTRTASRSSILSRDSSHGTVDDDNSTGKNTPTKKKVEPTTIPAAQKAAGAPPGASMAAILKREAEQQEKERQAKAAEQLRQQQAQQAALRQQQEAQLRQQQQQQEAAALRQRQEAAAKQKALQEQQQQQQAAALRQQQEAQLRQQQQAAAAAQQQQDAAANTTASAAGSTGVPSSGSSVASGGAAGGANLDIISGLNGLNLGSTSGGAPSSASSGGSAIGGTDFVAAAAAAANNNGMIQESFATIPTASDQDRNRTYTPQNPYPGTPSSYPSTPSTLFENPAVFEKLGTDALFFIFYYKQGTYQQYLAARELKKQSWRFHKKYMTWFQRHEEPKVTTDEYEQGTYVYFDYETGWCTRIKQDFRFEYSFLEDSLQ